MEVGAGPSVRYCWWRGRGGLRTARTAGEQLEIFRDLGKSSFREAGGTTVSWVQERAGGQKWERVSMDSGFGEICSKGKEIKE